MIKVEAVEYETAKTLYNTLEVQPLMLRARLKHKNHAQKRLEWVGNLSKSAGNAAVKVQLKRCLQRKVYGISDLQQVAEITKQYVWL
jgi:hypothetical protein